MNVEFQNTTCQPAEITIPSPAGSQANLPWRINSWWSMRYGLFTLPNNITLEVSGYYTSSACDGTVIGIGFGTIDMGINKELGKNGGVLQLSAADLFRTVKYKSQYGTLTPDVFQG